MINDYTMYKGLGIFFILLGTNYESAWMDLIIRCAFSLGGIIIYVVADHYQYKDTRKKI